MQVAVRYVIFTFASSNSTAPTTADPATLAKYSTKNLTQNIPVWIRPTRASAAHIHVGIILHRVDQGVEFFGIANITCVRSTPAGGVDSICEENDRFAAGHVAQPLVNDQIDC